VFLTFLNFRFERIRKQEAFEKCWAHSPQRAAARRITIHQVSLLLCRTPPAHRCPRRQRQRVTEGTALAPWNGPNKYACFLLTFVTWLQIVVCLARFCDA